MECKIVNMSTRQLKASWIREMVADLSMMHGSFDDVIREYTKEKRKIFIKEILDRCINEI
jgi:hypothetical protein